jgi:anti-sigma factor RsiW
MNCQTTQNLLNGYVDGELDLINHLQIEEHLQTCLSCRQANENLLKLKSAIDDKSLYFNASPDLQKRIKTALREENQESPKAKFWQWRWLAVAASTVFAVIILGLIFFQTNSDKDELLAKEVVSNHIRSMMENHLTDVPSSDQHTVKPWFDGKLDYSPPVIDLASQGFSLVGGRLDYAGSRPVAALVYQRRQHFINLFVFPSTDNSDSGNKMSTRKGYNLIRWSKSGMTFWAVSDLNLNELQEFTQIIQN